MPSLLLVADILLGGIGLFLVKHLFFSNKSKANAKGAAGSLPPGPTPRPLIGNLLDLPPAGQQEWIHWAKHKALYGPLSSITVFGQHIVIINDAQIAFDLFEKRSAIYSDRPTLVFGGEMCGWENTLAMQHYSPRFRAYRKNIYQLMGSKNAINKFNPLIEEETRRTLIRIVEDPQQLMGHIRTQAGAIILKMSHGYSIERSYRGARDPLVDLADEALVQFSLAATPGAWLVDVIPILRSLPSWIPGTAFQRTAFRWKRTLMELAEKPHAFVKAQMSQHAGTPSYTSLLLESFNKDFADQPQEVRDEEEYVIKWSAASMYSGGADTTVSANYSFFLAMTMYPEVFAKAQAEVDSVLGNSGEGAERLPTFEDRPRMPYVEALLKEVLRWNPVGPMGLPHVTTEDDVYMGYKIPKGAILQANIWQFTHDPEAFHDPFVFKPERFLGDKPEFDTHGLSFGFGRRICPGKELADASMFMFIATCLAVLDIRKARDDNGQVVEPVYQYTPGIISHPMEFKCSIRPRSERAAAIIKHVEDEHPFAKSDADAIAQLKWE
ncbi:cytochrome P450 [Schizopora paradoxa]|uniref:Cytochrome P450 n=1 Tax=Schizopora paradoxa TaxID=27342 RepID=A0A0H2RSB3_9AGAM|nr:cytochrome P450 [Schizopora paradoxa]